MKVTLSEAAALPITVFPLIEAVFVITAEFPIYTFFATPNPPAIVTDPEVVDDDSKVPETVRTVAVPPFVSGLIVMLLADVIFLNET